MINRISGTLEAIDGLEATVQPTGSPVAYGVSVPAYLAQSLRERVGQPVTLHTIHYLEGSLGGSSLIPRLVGFASAAEKRFFLLLTTVDGVGTRRALKALTQDPTQVARAIAEGDAAWLTQLPEIGKKTAEKVVLELKKKVSGFLSVEEAAALDAAARGDRRGGGAVRAPREAQVVEDAVTALMTLGEQRGEAERMVKAAMAKGGPFASAEELVSAAYGG